MSPCPPAEELQLLLDDQLSAAVERTLTAHVDTCIACQERLEQLTSAAHLSNVAERDGLDAAVPTIHQQRWLEIPTQAPPKPDRKNAPPAAESCPQVKGYEILAELGRGGMGVVYKARQRGLNRLVALKMILEGSHAGADQLARFRREAEAVARLQHPHIVQIHEIGEQDGRPFFSMELVSGGSLADHLDGTPLDSRVAAEIVETLSRAVHAAHLCGIIHRDLKPANVLLQSTLTAEDRRGKPARALPLRSSASFAVQDFTPKISDFGLAKDVASAARDGVLRTGSGAIMGSPSYMAPEQAEVQRAAVGPAADVYGLGAILYELLTGRPPFKAASPLETVLQVLHEEPVPPRRFQPRLPRDLETICMTCLHKEPRKRYATAQALAEDLRCFLAGEPIRARPIGMLERGVKWARRRPAVAALIAVSVLALVVVGAGTVWHQINMSAALQQANAERQRADANYREALYLILEFANKLREMDKHPEAVAMMTRAIEKQETLLQGEQDPQLRRILLESYAIRGCEYTELRRYREARADLERLPADDWSTQADLYRSLSAMVLAKLGEHKEAAAKAEALAQKTDLRADALFHLALAFTASIAAVRQDPKLSAMEKDQLANHYGSRAMALLGRTRSTGFFTDPAMVRELRIAFLDWGPLYSRADFKKLLAELEAAAVTAKP
jgi:tetratricopeptide (TPR) repeat protein